MVPDGTHLVPDGTHLVPDGTWWYTFGTYSEGSKKGTRFCQLLKHDMDTLIGQRVITASVATPTGSRGALLSRQHIVHMYTCTRVHVVDAEYSVLLRSSSCPHGSNGVAVVFWGASNPPPLLQPLSLKWCWSVWSAPGPDRSIDSVTIADVHVNQLNVKIIFNSVAWFFISYFWFV